MTDDEIERVETALAGKVICARCYATLGTYAVFCSAPLDVACPGFNAIEMARKEDAATPAPEKTHHG